MRTHLLGIVAATAFIVVCTLLPFLPGRYDSLAVPLSAMAQVAGTAGLVLVPIGLLSMVASRSQRLTRLQYPLAVLALTGASLVWALASVIASVQGGVVLGFTVAAVWIYAGRRIWSRLKQTGGAIPAVAHYVVAVPAAVALLQLGSAWIMAAASGRPAVCSWVEVGYGTKSEPGDDTRPRCSRSPVLGRDVPGGDRCLA